MNENSTKLTRKEKNWILYDVGNSAFTMMVSTVFSIYFMTIAQNEGISDGMSYWAYTTSIVTLIVALLGPIVGTIADYKNTKKPIFIGCIVIGVAGCVIMGIPMPAMLFLVVFGIAKLGYSASLIFYDSMLVDITTPDRMDKVSSYGYAWGYIGSCVPFIASIVVIMFSGLDFTIAMPIAFMINAIWWVAFTLPLLRTYSQVHYIERQPHAVANSFKRIGSTFAHMKTNKGIFLFLLAFFFYIDGVYTIIDMASAFGTALGFTSQTLLYALLATQFVAFPCAIIFGKLAKKVANEKLITVCITMYTLLTLFALQLNEAWEFWFLAVGVGMVQGGIQALSRSYFAKIVPPNQSGEFFGLYDIFGKGAAFFGTMAIGLITQLVSGTDLELLLIKNNLQAENVGVCSIAIFFILGLVIFRIAAKTNRKVIEEKNKASQND